MCDGFVQHQELFPCLYDLFVSIGNGFYMGIGVRVVILLSAFVCGLVRKGFFLYS